MAGCPITEKGKTALEAVRKDRRSLAIIYTAKDVVPPQQQKAAPVKGAATRGSAPPFPLNGA